MDEGSVSISWSTWTEKPETFPLLFFRSVLTKHLELYIIKDLDTQQYQGKWNSLPTIRLWLDHQSWVSISFLISLYWHRLFFYYYYYFFPFFFTNCRRWSLWLNRFSIFFSLTTHFFFFQLNTIELQRYLNSVSPRKHGNSLSWCPIQCNKFACMTSTFFIFIKKWLFKLSCK